ncbi:MAG TPA: hypothetical protein VL096_18435 [Pirellulaceae bacterium]|nr:hypothetical protein [Pirellulaceae bacterium]
MLCRQLFIAILLAICCCAPLQRVLAADTLRGARDDVRIEQPREESSSSSAPPAAKDNSSGGGWWSGTDDAHCDCDDDNGNATLGMIALLAVGAGIAVTSPYWVPIGLLEDDLARNGWYQAYPYACGSGSMVVGNEQIDALPPADRFAWLIRPRVEYGDDFDNLSRWGGQILIEPAWGSPNVCASRFGFDSETNYWRESLGGGQRDELWTGDANVSCVSRRTTGCNCGAASVSPG